MSTMVLKFAIGEGSGPGLHQVVMPEHAEIIHVYEEAGTVTARARVPVQPSKFKPVLFALATTATPVDDQFPHYIGTVHMRHTGLVLDVFACPHLGVANA